MPGTFCHHCAHQVGSRDRYCEQCGAWVMALRRDRVEADIGVAAGVSDRGYRHHRNEDAFALRNLSPGTAQGGAAAAVVCDGVSSSPRPDEAAEIAADVGAATLVAALRVDDNPVAATREAIRAADKAVAALADHGGSVGKAPACTFASAVVTEDTVTIGWVGDSRAYWIPQARAGSVPIRLTRDDSWLAQVLEARTFSPDQAAADRRAHAITDWLGEDTDRVDPHVVTIEPQGPGVVVVCSDGLWNYLDTSDELAAALPAQALDAPLDAARRLVEIALHSGGRDNITVAIVPFINAATSAPGALL